MRLTLQTWRVADAEIQEVEEEAQRLIQGGSRVADQVVDKWARVEVRAALDGLVLERNVSPSEIISVTDDLFKVADMSRLRVLAFAYEEDLPPLDTLASEYRTWRITIPADPSAVPQVGQIEQIGRVIDPMRAHGPGHGLGREREWEAAPGSLSPPPLNFPPRVTR